MERQCAKCNNPHSVEEHHIIPKWYIEQSDIYGRILLCKKCHQELQEIIDNIIRKHNLVESTISVRDAIYRETIFWLCKYV